MLTLKFNSYGDDKLLNEHASRSLASLVFLVSADLSDGDSDFSARSCIDSLKTQCSHSSLVA